MGQNKVMIVEDEVIVGLDLTAKLEKLGYLVISRVARYGEEVLDIATETMPDLILMDIKLKGEVDGIQAALMVQKQLGVPVIFLTAFSDQDTLADAKKAQPFAFLKKPVRLEDLKVSLEIGLYKAEMEKKLREKVIELEDALENVKTLKKFIPICTKCKKIRDDEGYWNRVEAYIEEHSGSSFTHSVCPTCMDSLYGNEEWYQNIKK